jgi:hypothetical protein
MRMETICRQTKMNTPGVPCKFWIKMVQSLPSLAIRRMRHDIGVLAITFPFLMPPHLLRCFFRQEQPFEPWRDRYVRKLFDNHFCGDRDSIFVYNLHVSGPTVMHTFGVIILLLPEQHAILFARINLLIVHAKTDHNLLGLV